MAAGPETVPGAPRRWSRGPALCLSQYRQHRAGIHYIISDLKTEAKTWDSTILHHGKPFKKRKKRPGKNALTLAWGRDPSLKPQLRRGWVLKSHTQREPPHKPGLREKGEEMPANWQSRATRSAVGRRCVNIHCVSAFQVCPQRLQNREPGPESPPGLLGWP